MKRLCFVFSIVLILVTVPLFTTWAAHDFKLGTPPLTVKTPSCMVVNHSDTTHTAILNILSATGAVVDSFTETNFYPGRIVRINATDSFPEPYSCVVTSPTAHKGELALSLCGLDANGQGCEFTAVSAY